jgi:hypothetical protein
MLFRITTSRTSHRPRGEVGRGEDEETWVQVRIYVIFVESKSAQIFQRNIVTNLLDVKY